MGIGSLGSIGSNLIQSSFGGAVQNAKNITSNPVEGAVGLMQNEAGVKLGSKVIQAQDEMLGTILDMKA